MKNGTAKQISSASDACHVMHANQLEKRTANMKRSLLLIFSIIAFSHSVLAQTSVVLSPWAQFHSVTQSGQPNAFGCVFTYVSGTVTSLSTFTDSTGLTTNPNPVILSAAGTANIWLQTGTAYTFKVVSQGGVNCATGTTIYTVNGIAGGGSSVVTTVTFSSTPTFTVTAQNQVFELTLTGNAAALPLAFSGVSAPAFITIQITEDAVGSHTFSFPSNALGASPIDIRANAVSSQTFIWNGTSTIAIGPTDSALGNFFSFNSISSSGSINAPTFSDITTPASSGFLRLSSTDAITWRNNANTGDITGLAKNSSDQMLLAGTSGTIFNGPLISANTPIAASGTLRFASGDSGCWRNGANSTDICLSKNANDVISIAASSGNPGLIVNGGYACNLNAQSVSYLALRTDCVIQANAAAGSITITIPHANTGQLFFITRSDTTSNTVNIAPDSGTINNLTSLTDLGVGGTLLCVPNGTNVNCTQPLGDTRDFSVTGCTPASSTDAQCTGSITISPAMANTNYIPMLTVNGNGGTVPNLTINVNGSLVTNSIPYNISCTFSCGTVNAPTIYVHIAQK